MTLDSTTHQNVAHTQKSLQEKAQLVKEKGACFCCITRGYRVTDCRRKKKCGVLGCADFTTNPCMMIL